ncbi:MAG: glycosyltransferase family 2 protein [Planctomycetota bacterium]|jgi:glycosyltransferase involved in cell wall biosynthesis
MAAHPDLALSVVVPAFNEVRTIGRCLAALRRQERRDVEVLVADDGSRDGTADLVARWFPQVRLLALPHRGSAAARNAAVRAARAPRIAFLDADCVPCPGWLAAVLAHDDESAVYMGCVRPMPEFRSRLVALLEFGEFLALGRRPLQNFALLNLAGATDLFRRLPIPDVPSGHDRIWSWQLARRGVPIRFDPAQAVVHAPPTDATSLLRRHVSYARRFVRLRRHEPTLPGGWLVRLGPFGTPLIGAARLVRDGQRLWGARTTLGDHPLQMLPLALALVAGRCLDMVVMLEETLRSPASARRGSSAACRRDRARSPRPDGSRSRSASR